MNDILIYSLKSALVLVMLYMPYILMLRKERFFRTNRIMLLSILFTRSASMQFLENGNQ